MTNVKVMELVLDLLQVDEFYRFMNEYLSNDYLNIVYLISMGLLEKSSEDEELHKRIMSADLLLPAEKGVLVQHHVDQLEEAGMMVDFEKIREAVEDKEYTKKTVYLLAENEHEIKTLIRCVKYLKLNFEIVGSYIITPERTEDIIVNDINIHAPDVILFSMKSPEQENWIENNKVKLNAKLCFVVGDVIEILAKRYHNTPRWIKQFHLKKVYKKLTHNWDRIHSRRMRIFEKKLDKYNNER